MKLTVDQIRAVTCGALNVLESDGGCVFRRFTEEQTEYYTKYRDDNYAQRTFAAAGVRLAFETDSEHLSFECAIKRTAGGTYCSFDIYVNDAMIAHSCVETGESEFGTDISLGEGVKKVEIYLPWSRVPVITALTLDDGAQIVPVKRSRIMMNYGDSITQGFTAEYPSLTYASRLARLLDADNYNKAISGDVFFPEILELPEDIVPDIVTVAYGTNDWYSQSRDTVAKQSREFYKRLSAKYPTAKIFAVSPLWRKDGRSDKFDGPCSDVHDIIAENCADLSNVTVINGSYLNANLLPFYADRLHPNDLGMGVYADALYLEIEKHL